MRKKVIQFAVDELTPGKLYCLADPPRGFAQIVQTEVWPVNDNGYTKLVDHFMVLEIESQSVSDYTHDRWIVLGNDGELAVLPWIMYNSAAYMFRELADGV